MYPIFATSYCLAFDLDSWDSGKRLHEKMPIIMSQILGWISTDASSCCLTFSGSDSGKLPPGKDASQILTESFCIKDNRGF